MTGEEKKSRVDIRDLSLPKVVSEHASDTWCDSLSYADYAREVIVRNPDVTFDPKLMDAAFEYSHKRLRRGMEARVGKQYDKMKDRARYTTSLPLVYRSSIVLTSPVVPTRSR